MPTRGGRVGGGSRSARSGGIRAPRSSAGGSKGFRVNIGNQAPRATSDIPDTNTSTSTPVHHRPWMRPRMSAPFGRGWKLIGIILGLFVLGMCACVGLGFLLQALGYGS